MKLVLVVFIFLTAAGELFAKHQLRKRVLTQKSNFAILVELTRGHAEDGDGGLIRSSISLEQFTNLFVNEPRNYSSLILFNANYPGKTCEECKLSEDSLNILATSYMTSQAESTYFQPQLFFVQILPLHQDVGILQMVGISKADLPTLLYIPASGVLENLEEIDHEKYLVTNPISVMEWIFKVSQIRINPQLMKGAMSSRYRVLDFLPIILAFLNIFVHRHKIIHLVLFDPSTFIAVVAVMLNCIFVSGHIWNAIQEAPFLGPNMEIISASARSQYGMESAIIMCLYLVITYTFIGLIEHRKNPATCFGEGHTWNGLGMFIFGSLAYYLVYKIWTWKLY